MNRKIQPQLAQFVTFLVVIPGLEAQFSGFSLGNPTGPAFAYQTHWVLGLAE